MNEGGVFFFLLQISVVVEFQLCALIYVFFLLAGAIESLCLILKAGKKEKVINRNKIE